MRGFDMWRNRRPPHCCQLSTVINPASSASFPGAYGGVAAFATTLRIRHGLRGHSAAVLYFPDGDWRNSQRLQMLVLTAPIIPLGGCPYRVFRTVVREIADHRRRCGTPAPPEYRYLAYWLGACSPCRPPELTVAASQVLVFPRHDFTPRLSLAKDHGGKDPASGVGFLVLRGQARRPNPVTEPSYARLHQAAVLARAESGRRIFPRRSSGSISTLSSGSLK